MQVKKLFKHFDRLQQMYGDKNLDAIYGCGRTNNPNFCLVFMNPTARNVAASKKWKGLKAPWIGTKNIWKLLYQLGFIDTCILDEINSRKPSDWNAYFSQKVYKKVHKNSLYITNLSKATQIDARPLKDKVFKEYLELFKEEIHHVKPKVILTFGNQVSSVCLGKNIHISEWRKKHDTLKIKEKSYRVFPIYYPVGQGMRNMRKAKEDIHWIMKNI